MAVSLPAVPNTPGIYLFEDKAGPQTSQIETFTRLYLICTTSLDTIPINTPTVIGSKDDFTNLFGSTDAIALNSIDAYLANWRYGLFIVRTESTPNGTVEIDTVTNSTAYTVTIAGNAVTYTSDANATAAEIIDGLVAAINDDLTVNVLVEAEYELDNTGAIDYSNSRFRIRSKSAATFTLTAGATMTASAVAAQVSPNYWDYLGTLKALEETQEDEELGFIAIPQAFYNLTNRWERTQVANQMATTAKNLRWFALIDPTDPAIVSHPHLVKADVADYNSLLGYAATYYPYFIDTDNDHVAPSVAIAAAALRLYARKDIGQPPAGKEMILDGISGVQFPLNQAQKVFLADERVNINVYARGQGTMPFDALTRSQDINYKFIHTRIILNSFLESLQATLRASNLLMQRIDGFGRFYGQLKLVVVGVCERFYQAGLLYGQTPEDAYAVLTGAQFQIPADLEAGIVYFECYLVPAPMARQIVGTTYRVAINQMARTVELAELGISGVSQE